MESFGFTLGRPLRFPGCTAARTSCSSCPTSKGSASQSAAGRLQHASAAMRNGDFSGRRRTSAIPRRAGRSRATTFRRTGWTRCRKGVLECYPEPNSRHGLSRNYLAAGPRTDKEFSQRIDFVESSKSFWFGRFSWTDEYVLSPKLKDNGQDVETNVKQLMVSNTRTCRRAWSTNSGSARRSSTTISRRSCSTSAISRGGRARPVHPAADQLGPPQLSITGFSGFGDNPGCHSPATTGVPVHRQRVVDGAKSFDEDGRRDSSR